MAYSLETALAIDELLQQNISLDEVFDILGIPADQQVNYQLSPDGNFVIPVEFVLETEPDPQFDPFADDADDSEEPVEAEEPEPQFDPFADDREEQVEAKEPEPQFDPFADDADDDETPDRQTAAEDDDAERGAAEQAATQRAREQSTLQQRYAQSTASGDWRVRIRLAPNANYLYRAENPGIMAPLKTSDGVIFPYLPQVQTRYEAAYDRRDLTHSNYRGYFYKNSAVGEISINGTFTAQDTLEAQYLLAVIHFFRSATKMFYGKDEFRGAPPPLVMLSGFGEYQFNNHSCLISNFAYNLPNGVDYIRVNPNNQGQNLVVNRNQVSSSPGSTIETAARRIGSLINLATGGKVQGGAQSGLQDLGYVAQTVSGTTQTTYVPTKMEIQITLLPVQTRSQVSQQFSLREFANGNLLKGGFW